MGLDRRFYALPGYGRFIIVLLLLQPILCTGELLFHIAGWGNAALIIVITVGIFGGVISGNPGLSDIINRQMKSVGLSGKKEFKLIYREIRPLWVKQESEEVIVRKIGQECRRIKHVLIKEEQQRRREILRRLAEEERLMVIEEKSRQLAERARERLVRTNSDIGAEIGRLRLETRGEPQDVAKLVEEEFIETIRVELSEDKDRIRSFEKKIPLIKKVVATSHHFFLLEEMPLADLQFLAEKIREIKRRLSRRSWHCFMAKFDATNPDSYRKLFELAKAGNYEEMETFLFEKQDWEDARDKLPQLLSKKRILLVGGVSNLSDFYLKQLTKLGASNVRHAPEGSVVRLKDVNVDLIMIFWRRITDNQRVVFEGKSSSIIYLERMGKCAFLKGVVDALQIQLS